MGPGDVLQDAAEQVAGTAEEAAGTATDDQRLETEGRTDRAAAKTKKVGEDVEDVLRRWRPRGAGRGAARASHTGSRNRAPVSSSSS